MSLLHRNLPTDLKVLVCLPRLKVSQPDARLRVLAAMAAYTEGSRVPRQLFDTTLAAREYDPFAGTADGAGPLGLTGHTAAGGAAVDLAIDLHQQWATAVTGTPKARDLRSFLAGWDDDADISEAVRRFAAQPRIHAMRHAERTTATRFPVSDYGPGLTAHQTGLEDYVPYFIDTVLFGDALITPDGQLIAPTGTGDEADLPILPRPWHTFDERLDYHQTARRILREATPDVIVVSVQAPLRARPVSPAAWHIEHPTVGTVELTAVRVPEAADPTELIICPAAVAETIDRPQLSGKIIGRVAMHGPRLNTIALHDPDDLRVGQRTALGDHNSPEDAACALLDYYLEQQR